MKLSTRLILIFLFMSVMPMAAIGYIGFRNGIQTIKQDTIDHLVSMNLSEEAEFNRWINDSRSQIKALAQRPLVRKFAAQLSSAETSAEVHRQLRRKIIDDHFAASIEAGIGFIDLSLLDKSDGRIMVSTDPRLEGEYREDKRFFVEGKLRTFVGEVAFWRSTEDLVMHISTPVVDEGGRLIAVLSGHVDWKEMSNIMRQGRGVSRSRETYLVNRFNYFVTESRFAKDYPLKKTVYTKGTEACLARRSGVGLYADYRGIPVIGAYRWMPEWGLCILTEEDQEEAFAPAVAFRKVVIKAGLAMGVLVTLVTFFLVRNITRRIHHLVDGAEAFSKGRYDFKIPNHHKDELGMLAESFNHMARARKKAEDAIRRSRDELELRVKDRTAEITRANLQLKKEIGERRQIEAALRGSEQEYRDLVENLDAGVVVHASDTRIVMSNHRAQALLGLSEDRMVGKQAADPAWHFLAEDGAVMKPEDYPVNQVLSSLTPLRNYMVGIENPKAEKTVWVMVNAFPKFSHENQVEHVVVTFWDITYRISAEAKIRRSLSEKEVLLREIHHRVKNNMQMIQSLLNLQAAKLGPDFKAALTDSNSRIKSMALVHETLYHSDDIANLDLDSYFRQLVKHLYKIYLTRGKSVETVYRIEPVRLDMDASIACGLILNELVTNALKYAFQNGSRPGVLEVGFGLESGREVALSVSDNGAGLPETLDMDRVPSLGLKIVTMLAEDQLNGRIVVERENGTRFRIIFPLETEK
jgi:PAS domain S-box-containing protein